MRTLFASVAPVLTVSLALAQAQPLEARFAAMTPEEVRAYEQDTLQRVADLSLIPPVINTHPLPKYDYDKLDYGMTIGIARTPGGRLWAAWIGGEDGPKAFMVAATSDDDNCRSAPRRSSTPRRNVADALAVWVSITRRAIASRSALAASQNMPPSVSAAAIGNTPKRRSRREFSPATASARPIATSCAVAVSEIW